MERTKGAHKVLDQVFGAENKKSIEQDDYHSKGFI
jgi:hypothetical protein